ncbi:M14 family zinc carboxypeptidase [Methylibium rhizosphaerae]|uniref:M14 family zinc carboxypeptidase n=1 Tax=Methylibium rhizosphaerae TaxID=2570323 RepID=UPI00112D9F21|nr:M14 family zinc carboxypeptidase [Methylibium rhizosphaerae]
MPPVVLPELAELQRLIHEGGSALDARVVCEVAVGGHRFPVHAIALGNPSPDVPAAGFFGGVHGLERIGAEVVIAYLRSLVKRLQWDSLLHRQLEGMRLVFMPLVNPGGLWRGTRANPQGVDLMRNAPVSSAERVPFLIGGQRLSAGLPWYRGAQDAPMEAESAALCRVVEDELLARPFSVALDCHSGFGVHDRIWFPYAHTARPIAHLAEMFALNEILDATHTHHRYVFEPQSRQYLAHGDLWDYLYLRAVAQPGRVFLPLTLEMGSWLWVKKNPRQLFSRHGIFNPLIEHRQQRVLRRHVGMLDFLSRAAASHERWLPREAARQQLEQQARVRWYARRV